MIYFLVPSSFTKLLNINTKVYICFFLSHCIYSALAVTQHLFQPFPGNFINVDPHSCDMIERCEEMFADIQGKALNGLNLQDKKDSVL